MKFRRYCDTDFEAVTAIYNSSKLDELKFERRQHTLIPLLEDHRRLERLLDSDIYVAIDENNCIVAYGAINHREIRALYVHPNIRGNGVGAKLLRYLISRIDGSATLNVARSNKPAITLYKKFGFTVVQKFRSSYNGVRVVANEMLLASKPPSGCPRTETDS
ncbi:hypothetical protein AB833_32480 [Chromatiales bacterium (ex Bugula neritina AB1)]|nr:hypothetical protein AB833_32480 [Chromatiales bacterium (ex Bugula neritina AB1)]